MLNVLWVSVEFWLLAFVSNLITISSKAPCLASSSFMFPSLYGLNGVTPITGDLSGRSPCVLLLLHVFPISGLGLGDGIADDAGLHGPFSQMAQGKHNYLFS